MSARAEEKRKRSYAKDRDSAKRNGGGSTMRRMGGGTGSRPRRRTGSIEGVAAKHRTSKKSGVAGKKSLPSFSALRRSSLGRTLFGKVAPERGSGAERESGGFDDPGDRAARGRRVTQQELIEGTRAAREEVAELLEFPADTWMINPNGKFFVWWSSTMFPCIVYAAIVTPFEIASDLGVDRDSSPGLKVVLV